jgi:hypothetical protein
MEKQKIVIDLNNNSLNEALYNQFSRDVGRLLIDMYHAGFDIPTTIRGTQEQIDSFFKALKNEKRYMDSYVRHGLDDSRTLSNRHRLMSSVESFENETGLRWPFKN